MQSRITKIILHIGFLILINLISAQDGNFDYTNTINTDSTYLKLDKNLEYFQKTKDTFKIIKTRMNRIKYFSKKGFYSKSYDEVWLSLPLVESPKFIKQRIEILDKLITLYIIFEQKEKAYENHKTAINLVENNDINKNDKRQLLARLYNLGAWIEIRLAQDFSKAEEFSLKSIEQYKGINPNLPVYSELQLAHIYIKKKELLKAKQILFKINNDYPMPLKATHALLFERIGQYYDIKGKRDSAIYYFKTSLNAMDEFETHPDKKLQVAKRLSDNYFALGNYKKAYTYLELTSDINDQIFSSSKSQNKELFEIKNKYEVQLKNNMDAIQSQKLKLLQNEKAFWKLKILITIVFLVGLFGFIFFYFNRRHRIKILNQDLTNQKQKLEIEKQDEILELKNKELLASALQLLERDTLQEDIKKELNTLNVIGDNISIVNGIKNALNTSTTSKWKEFQAHFTQVNDKFYSSLKEKYPSLTPTDLKMCAFIKLGFSSKDMAQIMNITVEGINTSRSRLRKKMKLDRKIVLSEFLQSYS